MQLLQICLWVSCTNSPLKRVSFIYTYACVFVHVLVSAYGIQKSIRSPGAGVPDGYEVPNCRELDYDPLKEQEALSTAKQFFPVPTSCSCSLTLSSASKNIYQAKHSSVLAQYIQGWPLLWLSTRESARSSPHETSVEWPLWTISLAESWLWYLQSSVRSFMLGRRLRR